MQPQLRFTPNSFSFSSAEKASDQRLFQHLNKTVLKCFHDVQLFFFCFRGDKCLKVTSESIYIYHIQYTCGVFHSCLLNKNQQKGIRLCLSFLFRAIRGRNLKQHDIRFDVLSVFIFLLLRRLRISDKYKQFLVIVVFLGSLGNYLW